MISGSWLSGHSLKLKRAWLIKSSLDMGKLWEEGRAPLL